MYMCLLIGMYANKVFTLADLYVVWCYNHIEWIPWTKGVGLGRRSHQTKLQHIVRVLTQQGILMARYIATSWSISCPFGCFWIICRPNFIACMHLLNFFFIFTNTQSFHYLNALVQEPFMYVLFEHSHGHFIPNFLYFGGKLRAFWGNNEKLEVVPVFFFPV